MLDLTIISDTIFEFIRYPLTPEEFYQRRLPGMWEEERAGKRMKLPVPETWETQVSLKGNKAETWQDLLGRIFLVLFYFVLLNVCVCGHEIF